MPTEHISERYVELDSWSAPEMIAAMYEGQLAAADAVRNALPAIAAAVEDALAPLGVKIRETPLTPDRILDLIEKAKAMHG